MVIENLVKTMQFWRISTFEGTSVMLIGQERIFTESRLKRNFGMARPEGYRKSSRLMELAEKFDLPIVTFVDTEVPILSWSRTKGSI